MATFTAESRDRSGRIIKETIDASTRREAIALLEGAGLFPIEVKEILASAGSSPSVSPSRGEARPTEPKVDGRVDKRIRGKQLLNFTIQLGSTIRAGVPILGALQSISKQSTNPSFKAVVGQMCADLEGGESLSGAMKNHPKAFPRVYSSTVAAGEQSGSLDDVLENLAEYVEADMELRADVRSALLYPVIVVATLFFAVSVLIVFVVPRFAGFYSGFQTELPLPTRILIALSSGVTEYFAIVLFGLGVLGYSAYQFVRRPSGQALVERICARTPVIGNLMQTANTLRVTQMLGLFTKAGVPILEGLRTIATTTSSLRMQQRLMNVVSCIASGQTLAEGLDESDCLPPTARQMLAAGESTGNLEHACETVSRQFKKELRYVTRNLATLIEPFLTLVLAVIVLFVALAVFLPMWDMVKVIRK